MSGHNELLTFKKSDINNYRIVYPEVMRMRKVAMPNFNLRNLLEVLLVGLAPLFLTSCANSEHVLRQGADACKVLYQRIENGDYGVIYSNSDFESQGTTLAQLQANLQAVKKRFGTCSVNTIRDQEVFFHPTFTSVEFLYRSDCQKGKRLDTIVWKVGDKKSTLMKLHFNPIR